MVFIKEIKDYAWQIKSFDSEDWLIYFIWIGLMMGLFFSVAIFLYTGHSNGVEYPTYVWNIPIGILIFAAAIGFDTIGHRTTYKEELKKAEALVHHITIFAGITSTILLCLAYSFPVFLRIPCAVLIFLSVLYSVIDEGFHWHRYWRLKSDRVEMASHFFIFLGHMTMIFAWWKWFDEGYPGVKETLIAMRF
jgi:hypothetical protein